MTRYDTIKMIPSALVFNIIINWNYQHFELLKMAITVMKFLREPNTYCIFVKVFRLTLRLDFYAFFKRSSIANTSLLPSRRITIKDYRERRITTYTYFFGSKSRCVYPLPVIPKLFLFGLRSHQIYHHILTDKNSCP